MNTVQIHKAPREVPFMPSYQKLDEAGINLFDLKTQMIKALLEGSPVDYVKHSYYENIPTTARSGAEAGTWSIQHNGHIIWFKQEYVDGKLAYLCTRIKINYRLLKGITFRVAAALNYDPYSNTYHEAFNYTYAELNKKK